MKDYEWIVIDGASHDGTQDWLTELDHGKNEGCWISEKDTGLYDAMNKGITHARGRYVLFMNAGDQFANPDVLERIIADAKDFDWPDFLYGDGLEESVTGKRGYKKARPADKIVYGMVTHHQAMLYKRVAIGDLRYDLQYKLAADYDFTARFLDQTHSRLYYDFPLCIFEAGGLSQRQARESREEEFQIRQNLGLTFWPVNFFITARQTIALVLKKISPNLYYNLRNKLVSGH